MGHKASLSKLKKKNHIKYVFWQQYYEMRNQLHEKLYTHTHTKQYDAK